MKILVSLFLSISIIAITGGGCDYYFSNPTLHLTNNAEKEIDQIVSAIYQNGQFAGSVLVSVGGNVLYKKAFGFTNIQDSIKNTCDTKFRIASFTKPFTVMLILQLLEEGKLELDGKLTDYLPEFPKEKGEGITIHHLLTHTSGITGESRIPNLVDIEKEYYSREKLLNCIIERDVVFEPGKDYEYSNFGFAILGMIIEKVSGKSYEELLQEKICEPAGMKNTMVRQIRFSIQPAPTPVLSPRGSATTMICVDRAGLPIQPAPLLFWPYTMGRRTLKRAGSTTP